MKKYILLVVVLIAMAVSASGQMFDCTTPPCYGNTECCPSDIWGNWIPKVFEIELDDFPGCTLTVQICYRECATNGKCVELYVKAVQFYAGCGCQAYYDWIESAPSDYHRWRRFRETDLEIIRKISRREFDNFVNMLPSGVDPPKCDQNPPEERFKVTAFQASCVGFCYVQYPEHNPSDEMYVHKVDCGLEFCCKITHTFCVEADGTTRHDEEISDSGNPDCDGTSISAEADCVDGFNQRAVGCYDYCGED